ncbi:MAG: energy transducer TonB [Smithella sp.]
MESTNKQISMFKAMFISLAIHSLCFAGTLFFMTLKVHQPETVQILLATLDPAGGGGEIHQTIPGVKKGQNQPHKRSPKKQTPSRQIPLPDLSPAKVPSPADKATTDNFPSLNPMSNSALETSAPIAAAAAKEGSGTGSGGGTGNGMGGYNGPGRGRSSESLKNQYLREHFAYIRDLILKNITYPPMAKKIGWQGKVLVSFIIMEDGKVSSMKIVKSSGHVVLDRNVLETIREVQPFPKPPVRAELFIPVNYVLKS